MEGQIEAREDLSFPSPVYSHIIPFGFFYGNGEFEESGAGFLVLSKLCSWSAEQENQGRTPMIFMH